MPGRGRGSIFVALSHSMAALRVVNWAAVFRSSFMLLFLAYPGVSLKVLRVFRCREVDGTHYLVADMRLQCFTGEWGGYAAYSLLVILVYVVGLPLTVFLILFARRRTLFGKADDPLVMQTQVRVPQCGGHPSCLCATFVPHPACMCAATLSNVLQGVCVVFRGR